MKLLLHCSILMFAVMFYSYAQQEQQPHAALAQRHFEAAEQHYQEAMRHIDQAKQADEKVQQLLTQGSDLLKQGKYREAQKIIDQTQQEQKRAQAQHEKVITSYQTTYKTFTQGTYDYDAPERDHRIYKHR